MRKVGGPQRRTLQWEGGSPANKSPGQDAQITGHLQSTAAETTGDAPHRAASNNLNCRRDDWTNSFSPRGLSARTFRRFRRRRDAIELSASAEKTDRFSQFDVNAHFPLINYWFSSLAFQSSWYTGAIEEVIIVKMRHWLCACIGTYFSNFLTFVQDNWMYSSISKYICLEGKPMRFKIFR